MSVFLGPIHTWLYNKIKLQNELTDSIVFIIEKKGYNTNLKSLLDKRYGNLEEGDLEDVIDEGNIHGWLQERVGLVENRLATAVEVALDNRPDCLMAIIDEAFKFGQRHKVDDKLNLRETYQYLDSVLLNGMPCDHVNIITTETEKMITWEQTTDIHKAYWDIVKGDVVNYYDIRNAVIEGMLSGTEILYAETGVNQYELRVR